MKKYFKNRILDLKYFVTDYINLQILNRLSPASLRERQLIKELRRDIRKTSATSGASWSLFKKKLKLYVTYLDPRNFLQWEFIRLTMVMHETPDICLNEMKKSIDWENKWRDALIEEPFGGPTLHPVLEESSGTTVVHAWHLFNLKKHTNIDFDKLDCVIEFGGGYGNMCKLLRKLGFKGDYIIYDLPEFLALQRFYLQGIGLHVADGIRSTASINGENILVSDIGDFKSVLGKKKYNNTLFIATWSLSESPMELRATFLPLVAECDFFLYGYQKKFDNLDNVRFFDEYKEKNSGIVWENKYLDFWSGYYLLGYKPK